MNEQDTRRLLAFLKRNGAFIESHDDVVRTWAWTLRAFTAEQAQAGALWFLERNHPREVAPATVAAATRSLTASGRMQDPRCPDHPGEAARACRACAADVLAGDRPRELSGKSLHSHPSKLDQSAAAVGTITALPTTGRAA
ncbi:hypothetical protein [Kocuria marina]|uniref:hypothetical protein n=1 Tax=Kocuria marina TaxID=223184 RepID=UPI0022E017C6|nr:hypothetical protein [Kocuria marina]